MQKILSTIFMLLILSLNSFGQLSQGGFPMEVSNLKSTSIQDKILKMPSFDFKKEEIENDQLKNSKSLIFAHSFPVSLSPQNSGTWYDIDGYKVWQLAIQSEGAFSINIIFSTYSIPPGARLFVYNKDKSVIRGAFTSQNNKPYKKLAIYPVPGDELIIQYEEPDNAAFKGELEIGQVNHDYKGIFDINNRWKRRLSQECNVDVQCEFESELINEKRAVCRILVGNELGTGTLVNNVLQDKKPYLLTAFHIYNNAKSAEIALYDFNYESPLCTGLEGSDIQSLSGSTALASFDSTDLMLVELSELPPPEYRPYFAGWDASHSRPSNSYIIHHPNGDTKKITHDTGTCDSAKYNNNFINYGHWKVHDWESGTTEGGSSGGGLFNNDKHLVGILSGGNASCEEITFDLFARFDKLWNYRTEHSRQVKNWLDPGNTGTLKLGGYDPYKSTSEECNLISNFMTEDKAVILPLNTESKGYYSGNNKMNITEIAECFSGYDRAVLNGISFGISRFKASTTNPEITVRIYAGDSIPDFAVKQFKFPMSNLTAGAMNFLAFSDPIEVKGNFFIGMVIPEEDSLVIFQSAFRPLILKNSMIVKQNNEWKPITQLTGDQNNGASILLQAMICDASLPDTLTNENPLFKVYPNPASNYIVLEFKERAPYEFSMYDMTGRLVLNDCFENRLYSEINISGIQPGIYLIRVKDDQLSETKRIIIN